MNEFSLPYCLMIEEGIYEHLDEALLECIPGIADKKVMIVTEPALQNVIAGYLDEMKRDLRSSELFFIKYNSFEQARQPGVTLEYKNDARSEDGENFSCYIANAVENAYDMYIQIFADAELTDQLLLTGLLRPGTGHTDRKSTRLNSSH